MNTDLFNRESKVHALNLVDKKLVPENIHTPPTESFIG